MCKLCAGESMVWGLFKMGVRGREVANVRQGSGKAYYAPMWEVGSR